MRYRLIEITGPPCPWCNQPMPLFRHWRERRTERECIQHVRRCPEVRRRVRRAKKTWMKVVGGRFKPWWEECWKLIKQAHAPLSDLEIRVRQRLAAYHLTRKQRQLGGRNQSIEDKTRGGKLGSHRRWHSGRGIFVKGCPWCRSRT